jgi:predicted nucleic acid-binding Zn ribbon protein
MQLKEDRDKIRSGYSPWVLCNGFSWSANGGYQGRGIRWDGTVRTAVAYFEGDSEPPIRVPGFLLRGERVLSLKTFRPSEYATAWEDLNLDGYLHAWSALKGERRCLQCLEPLPGDSSPSKRFCADKCRNVAKQRRFREQNPEGADRARKRYWESVEIEDDDA